MSKNLVVILAGGKGERISCDIPKQFIKVAGKAVLEHTLLKFDSNKIIDEIIVITNPVYKNRTEELIVNSDLKKKVRVFNGGTTRRESSTIGVSAIQDNDANVLIHDAVRPFVSNEVIEECIKKLKIFNAVTVAIPTADTMIEVDDNGLIRNIPNRKYILRGLTPQGFKVGTIKRAHELAERDNDTIATDDCALILKYKLGDICVVEGNKTNIKITYSEDIYLAEKLFQV